MSLRLRLALAFVLLSALPLGAFAAYSYLSSKSALRAAAQAEAEATARELEQRVANATADLDRRLGVLSTLPVEAWVAESERGERRLAPQLAELDQALPYLESIRFVAESPAPPAPPAAVPAPAPPPVPAPPTVAAVVAVPPVPATFALPDAARLGGVGGEEGHRLVVEIAKIQAAALAAAKAAAGRGGALGPAEIESMTAELEARARELERSAARGARAAQEFAARTTPAETRARERSARAGGGAREHAGKIAGSALECSISDRERVVGQLRAKIKAKQLFHAILSRIDRKRGEIPFALGAGRELLASSEDDAARLERIRALDALRAGAPVPMGEDDWIVVAREEPATGYTLGIARPLSGAIAELRRAAARNFALGLALVGIATAGFFPLTSRLVRSVRELDRGAARIAAGDLATRVAVSGRDELGRLGASFNRMAGELAAHRERLLADERRRKEEEIERRLLEAENERRKRELDEARDFQLSLLPRELPRIDGLDLAVEMTTATEVGGDYYDFQPGSEGELVLAIGDATGHGAAAGTLVTAVKSLFAAAAASEPPAQFLAAANAAIHRMGLVRRAMALAVARLRGARVVLSSAGMPPVLHFRAASGEVDELVLPGTPLGSRAGFPYSELELALEPGDALLFVSDGLPELPNRDGEPYGYERLRAEFGRLAREGACEVVAGLRAAARDWSGGAPLVDDVTLLAVRRA
jgi:serine phosphatase RsbU (regulator of sigma subunit)